MTPADYEFLSRFLKDRSGLLLAPEKQYLVESRLMPLARRTGCATIGELIQRIRTSADDSLKTDVIDAMMNNESFFYRDKIPFDLFAETAVPELLKRRAGSRRLRVWSAACSTGQEPYSIAMALAGMPALAGWQLEILATDLSTDALEKAELGVYSQFEVQRGLPTAKLLAHFTKVGEQWRIADEIRRMVRFRQVNLISDFAFLGVFDVVFCRNVLIYFDQPTKVDVLARMRRATSADGYLILGAAETVVGLGDVFQPVPEKRGLYRPWQRTSPGPTFTPVAGGAKVA